MLGDCASGRRIGAVGVNILAINILSSGGESAAMLATSIALFETVKLELYETLATIRSLMTQKPLFAGIVNKRHCLLFLGGVGVVACTYLLGAYQSNPLYR